jgi:catechol 2,3-dioxygenase-like lactoylglutathione lyase family enzyme
MIGRWQAQVIDCPDPSALAAFYQELLGLERIDEDSDWVTIGHGKDWPQLAFQLAPDLKAPRWPDPDYPQQTHLDIRVDDIATAEPAVLALGATKLSDGGRSFRVYADPAGHPFCLTW